MIDLLHILEEKDTNTLITREEAESLSSKRINELLHKYPIDVTYHLDSRFRNIIGLMKQKK